MGDNGDEQNFWTHRIPREQIKYLREDGQPDIDKIRTICTAIERECVNATIRTNVRGNGTTEFFVTGSDEDAGMALELLHQRLRGNPAPDRPPRVVPLTADNIRQHNKALTERRQFACGPCVHVWWRISFAYKPVSRCRRCHIRYDPIPRHLEFGHGHYRCPNCGNTFTGRARAGVQSPCYRCGAMVIPQEIGPRTGAPDQRTGKQHACAACNNGQIRPCPNFNRLPVCSHPHDSTGSTVSTFLTQQSDIDIDLEED